MEPKKRVVCVAGPTAVGKSAAAAELARALDGEVISADSMQVYRYMDIGSAKVTTEEMLGVPHHMIDVADPTEAFDVVRYQQMASACLSDILERGKLPVICGGTGFYIQALLRQIDFTENDPDPALREELAAFAEENGNEALHARLAAVDPQAAEAIHPNNRKRVIRALEYFAQSGEPISAHNARQKAQESPFDVIFFYLDDRRDALYERIDRRVDFMLEEGLVDEVQYLKAMGLTRQHVSMQGLGYKEVLAYLEGECDLPETVRILKRDTRHYAKRQQTWFAREKDTVHLLRGDYAGREALLARMLQELTDRSSCKERKGT